MLSFSTTLFCFFYSSSTTKLYDQKLYSRLAVKTWQSVTSASAKSIGKFPLTLQQQKFSTIPIARINSKLLLLTNDSQGVSVYKHMLFVGHSLEKKYELYLQESLHRNTKWDQAVRNRMALYQSPHECMKGPGLHWKNWWLECKQN